MPFSPLLLGWLRQNIRASILAVALNISVNLLSLCIPFVLSQAMGALLGFTSARAMYLGIGTASFPQLTAWLMIMLLVRAGLEFARRWQHMRLSEGFTASLRRQLFEQHLRLPLSRYEDKGEGRFLLRFSGDLGSAHQMVGKGVFQFLSDASMLILGIALIMWIDLPLGMLVCALLLLVWAPIAWLNYRIGQVETRRRNKKSRLLAFVSHSLRHMASLKAFNRATRETGRMEVMVQRVCKLGLAYGQLAALVEALAGFGLYAIILAVLLFSWSGTGSAPSMHADTLFAVVLMLVTWRPVLLRLLQTGMIWKRGGISLRTIQRLMDEPTEPPSPRLSRPTLAGKKPPVLAAEQLSVTLQGHAVVHNVSFVLNPEETLVIYGPAGSGKTVLTKTLAGLYTPTSGRLTIDGYPFNTWGAHAWRKQLALVSDALPLFGNSLLDAVSNSSKPKNRAKAADLLEEWKRSFPILQSVHPDMAPSLLSANQMRVLACLRLILTDKPIWVLDEPFKGIEPDVADRLWRMLEHASRQKSVLLFSGSNLDQNYNMPQLPINLEKKITLAAGNEGALAQF